MYKAAGLHSPTKNIANAGPAKEGKKRQEGIFGQGPSDVSQRREYKTTTASEKKCPPRRYFDPKKDLAVLIT